MTERFDAYCRQKEREARAAAIPGYSTIEEHRSDRLIPIENDWSRALFNGPFFRSAEAADAAVPVTSLVFVESRDHNTVAADPSSLGGGATDLHLVYEGLSRVDADAVMAGAATARGRDIVFSVWHPELVALRRARGAARHPAQVVVTSRGDLRFDDGLMFQEPELAVFVIAAADVVSPIRQRVHDRPWIDVIDAGRPVSLVRALRELKSRGIRVLSCVGGRTTATALLQSRLVSDIYLTTSPVDGGEPGTPYYDGPPLPFERVVRKAGHGPEDGVRFEHLAARP